LSVFCSNIKETWFLFAAYGGNSWNSSSEFLLIKSVVKINNGKNVFFIVKNKSTFLHV